MPKIKFYGVDDMSCGYVLKEIEIFVNQFDSSKILTNINDAIEYYNVSLYIKKGLYLKNWSTEFKEKYDSLKPLLEDVTKDYFLSINDSNVNTEINNLDYNYECDLLNLFVKFELCSKISYSSIKKLLDVNKIHLYNLLSYENIVNTYEDELCDEIISNPKNAELIINKYIPSSKSFLEKLYFPKKINLKDMENLILRYIELSDPNINYLILIQNYKNNKNTLNISNEIKYKAKKKIKEILSKLSNSFSTSCEVCFCSQSNVKSFFNNGGNLSLSFDKDWILNNSDYPTLLNNFIYLFDYVDKTFRINLLNNACELSITDKIARIYVSTDYFESSAFCSKDFITISCLTAYSVFLSEHEIYLENVIEYFYHEHIVEFFGIQNFKIHLPTKEKDYYEKCKSIAPELESIIKQYFVLVSEGLIDHEYIAEVNPTVRYDAIPSKISNKYAYENNNRLSDIMHLLFSDQSILHIISRLEHNEKNLFLQIINNDIFYQDFNENKKFGIDFLVNKNIIEIYPSNSKVKFKNLDSIKILLDLYELGFICVPHYCDSIKSEIFKMKDAGDLIIKDTLLSNQEADYFDYHLNSSKFGNSLDLRNKYLHASAGGKNEKNQIDYFHFLKLLILLTIKINDELELWYNQSNS